MRANILMLAPLIVLLVGCQSRTPATSSTPGATPTRAATTPSGIEGLRADVNARGLTAEIGSAFMSEPVGGQGTTLCVGTETLQVYEFIDHEAALAASAKIDRDDPSKIGNGIVDWTGSPRFWLRGNVIVLYLGDDAATDGLLRDILGPPFAESHEPGRGGFLPELPCQ
jgi:hypothetical protein